MNRACALGGRWLAMLLLALAPAAPAQSPDAQIWTSATSGIRYKLRISARRVQAEKIFAPEFQFQVDRGAYARCEYSPQDGAWTGKCVSHLPVEGTNGRPKWCTIKFASKITSLTPDRIEGESDVWASEDVDVRKCEVRKSHTQRFVWILKD